MIRKAILTATILIIAALQAAAAAPRVFSLDPNALNDLRERIATSKFTDPALDQLRADADRALKTPPLSVTHKQTPPPSGDKHDYMSLAPYWWPDPHTPNGMPYIRRDGERNPAINKVQDHKEFSELMSATRTLALAYYLFGEEAYASKATELLRAWFVDPQTRMNPNLTFAQAVMGRNNGRGTGLIETRELSKIVDGVGLLAGSRAWTAADQKAVEAWCAAFLDWMQRSDNGKDEARARNNHGSFYDVQVVSLALFTRDSKLAKRVLQEACKKRIQSQIESDGRQPLELARTKSMSYSTFNLAALFALANAGDRVGVDLWNCPSKDGAGIRKALDFLVPFAGGQRKWTYEQIEPFNPREIAPLLAVAAVRYQNPAYRDLARQIDPQITRDFEYLMTTLDSRKKAAGE